MLDLSNINKTQEKAIKAIKGPVAVIAGAGSGKTRTLTYRIAYLIYSGVDPDSIVAVTFTNKAAAEMKQRVINLVGEQAKEINISTFHSFCAQFLRREIQNLDRLFNHRFLIIDEDDSKQIIRDTVKQLKYDSDRYNSNRLKSIFSMFKNDQIDLLDFPEMQILQNYNKYLEENNSLDFDDLINLTIEVLKRRDDVKKHYNNRYQYLLIDEFQDTNKNQYQLIKLLAGKSKNIFTVGDPDQSIYSFRGANYENQKLFIDEFDPKIIILEQNYRSTMNILKAANKLIAYNVERTADKELKSELGSGSEVIFETRQTDRDEAYFVTRAIEILVSSGYSYSDIAVLYRSNSISRIFEESFIKERIPYVVYGGTSFFSRKEVKDILAYLRVVLNRHDNISFKRIVNTPRRKIGAVTIGKLEAYSNVFSTSLYDAIEHADLGPQQKASLNNFKHTLDLIEAEIKKTTDLTKIVDLVNDYSGYKQMLISEGHESKDRLENIQELKAIFYAYSLEDNDDIFQAIEAVLDDLSLKTNLDIDDTENTVKLATVHQVKGLEFKVVFVVALEETIFPAQASMFSSIDLEEERRICYVAVTRAKERLILSHALQRYRFGEVKWLMPSRYINEMRSLKEEIEVIEETSQVDLEPLSLGDRVEHPNYGFGVVVALDDEVVKVAFGHDFGLKIFKRDHPIIKKVKK
ncbi:MAG: UvrD-helicase domain-containing protein [Acholeplasmataceae bacterium]|jgi:DNA helicase-2/ATP-dependent DNA helicase PcrA|nr:UvrD-helicase domain-containing protein [Acholeplasmataceae bacterium]